MNTLEQAIKEIDFKSIKDTLHRVKVVIDNDYIESIEFDYCDSDCEFDKKGFSYCITIKQMPFHIYPMRSYNYVQTYQSVKRMLNRLYKSVKPETMVKRTEA